MGKRKFSPGDFVIRTPRKNQVVPGKVLYARVTGYVKYDKDPYDVEEVYEDAPTVLWCCSAKDLSALIINEEVL